MCCGWWDGSTIMPLPPYSFITDLGWSPWLQMMSWCIDWGPWPTWNGFHIQYLQGLIIQCIWGSQGNCVKQFGGPIRQSCNNLLRSFLSISDFNMFHFWTTIDYNKTHIITLVTLQFNLPSLWSLHNHWPHQATSCRHANPLPLLTAGTDCINILMTNRNPSRCTNLKGNPPLSWRYPTDSTGIDNCIFIVYGVPLPSTTYILMLLSFFHAIILQRPGPGYIRLLQRAQLMTDKHCKPNESWKQRYKFLSNA